MTEIIRASNWMRKDLLDEVVFVAWESGSGQGGRRFTRRELLSALADGVKYVDCKCGAGAKVLMFSEDFASVFETRCRACGREGRCYIGSSETPGKRDWYAELTADHNSSEPKQ